MEPEPQDPHVPPPKTDPLLESILLPKKEGPPMGSARRIDASILLEQETLAGEVGMVETMPRPPTVPTPEYIAPVAPITEIAKESTTPQVETYQRDIQNAIETSGASVVSIATAEAERRAKNRLSSQEEPARDIPWRKFAMILSGILLVAIAVGVIAYVAMGPSRVATPVNIPAPFITVDETRLVPLLLRASPAETVAKLTSGKDAVAVALGLVERLLPTVASTSASSPVQEMDAQTFLTLLASNVPLGLVRTLQPRFLLGIHSFAQNQPFLIFGIDAYEQAFSQMLMWEDSMQQDLASLFTYTPLSRINQAPTETSTPEVAQLLRTPFVDAIVENHDARVLRNQAGDILLLWTFLDRQTLVITTNEATLGEIITRLQASAVTPIP